jgi:hypothetical protein
MTARQDVLRISAERGMGASRSEAEVKDLVKVVQVFRNELQECIGSDDVPGVLVTAGIMRAGRYLGGGMVLALGDRMVIGWLKGLLKRTTLAVIPYSAIRSVEEAAKVPGQLIKSQHALVVEADETWELFYSPDVPAGAPLYGILRGLLEGRLTTAQLQDVFPVE